MASPRILGAASALAFVTFACAARAETPYFLDGARRVDVERVDVSSESRPGLREVRLRYAGREAPVSALVDDTMIVRLEPGAEERLGALGLQPVREIMPSLGLWLVADVAARDGVLGAHRVHAAPEIARAAGVLGAMPNLYVHHAIKGGSFTPNDPEFGGQWFWGNLKMPDAWGITQGDASTSIVVVDTGCDLQHPDLVAKLDPGRDVVDEDDDPSFDPDYDGTAHGTACAGLVAADTNNDVGVAGACPACRLRCVRLITDKVIPTSSDIEAFQFVIDTGAAVASNSWGYQDPMPVPAMLADAINEVFDNGRGGKGALVVFAMGNDDRVIAADELEAVRGVLGVGAVNNLESATPFTNTGPFVDVVAYTGTTTTDISGPQGDDPGDYTSLFGGTSSACPIVAGIAGLLVSAAPDMTAAELYDVITSTAREPAAAAPDEAGHDDIYGFGIVDPVAALTKLTAPPTSVTSTGAGAGGSGEGGAPSADDGSGSGCSCTTSDTSAAALTPAFALALAIAFVAAARRRRR